jgi:hypothetical protein
MSKEFSTSIRVGSDVDRSLPAVMQKSIYEMQKLESQATGMSIHSRNRLSMLMLSAEL